MYVHWGRTNLVWLNLSVYVVATVLVLYSLFLCCVAPSDQKVDVLAGVREQLEQSRNMVHGLQQEVSAPEGWGRRWVRLRGGAGGGCT